MKQNFNIEEELLKQIIEITDVDYTGDLELKDIENMIKDLIVEYHKKQEELEEFIEDRNENWKQILYKGE